MKKEVVEELCSLLFLVAHEETEKAIHSNTLPLADGQTVPVPGQHTVVAATKDITSAASQYYGTDASAQLKLDDPVASSSAVKHAGCTRSEGITTACKCITEAKLVCIICLAGGVHMP